ncbi:MAG: MmgE/PrpD family protein [Myxococcales bacterium]|nr:MmgE/PrpD family protein [Myxococcales bacterium]
MTGLTRELARHIAGTDYEALPARARSSACLSLLDAVGTSLAASALAPACLPFARLAAQCAGGCTVLAHGFKTSPLMAAFANGALAHALDYEDVYEAAPVHPNAAAIPATLALCEQHPEIDGKSMVTALAVGCDLVCRLGRGLPDNPDRYGFYTPAVLSTFGAAAASAKLLGLDEDGVVATLSLALSQSMASSQFKVDPDSELRAVREAFPARAGLTAALLAQAGAGGFEAPLEGQAGLYAAFARGQARRAEILEGLGQRFLGSEVSFKPWPSCRGTHAFIEAAIALKAEHDFTVGDIARLQAQGAALNRMLVEPARQKLRPQTSIDAKFSLPFCVGVALAHDTVTLSAFSPDSLCDPSVLSIADRLSFSVLAESAALGTTGGVLEVQLRDGLSYVARVKQPLGHPDNPLDERTLVAKFVDCVGRAANGWTARRARDAADAILNIEAASSASAALHLVLS